MNPESIPTKTSKGAAEIETRAAGLHPKLRQALVRVDGVKSLATLVVEAGAMGEALEGQLEDLLAQGFIIDAAQAGRPTAAESSKSGPAEATRESAVPAQAKIPDGLSATLPLNGNPEFKLVTELKASIRWLLADAMGGAPNPMELKLNHCRTLAELDKVIDEAFVPIQDAAGKPKAAHFWREAKALVKAAP